MVCPRHPPIFSMKKITKTPKAIKTQTIQLSPLYSWIFLINLFIAEGERFELSVGFTPHTLSPAQSGRGEIRTRGAISGTRSFQDRQLNHSCTLPLCAGLRFVSKIYQILDKLGTIITHASTSLSAS